MVQFVSPGFDVATWRSRDRNNFWTLKLYRETSAYVPKLLALAHIVAHPDTYDFVLPFIPSVPQFAPVKTHQQIDLAQAAGLIGIDSARLYDLNPQLNQLATSFEAQDTELLVPFELGQHFEEKLTRLSPAERRMWISYRRQGTESYTAVARKFGLTLNDIAQVNDLRHQARYLLIPLNGANYQRFAHLHTTPSNDELGSQDIVYTTRPGDSLWKIAREFDVSVSQLALWNNLDTKRYLRLNHRLIIRKNTATSGNNVYALKDFYRREVIRVVQYRVRRGDSLGAIAARYNLDVDQIRTWNRSVSGYLRPGQYLTLYLDITRLL